MSTDSKVCPYCAETIKAAAIKCRYCLSDLTTPDSDIRSISGVAQDDPARNPPAKTTSKRTTDVGLPRLGPRVWWVYLAAEVPRTVGQLAAQAEIGEAAIKRHLKSLIDHDLIQEKPSGSKYPSTFVQTRKPSTAELRFIHSRIMAGGISAPRTSQSPPMPNVPPMAHRRVAPAPAEAVARSSRPNGAVPVSKWRGLTRMTKQATVRAFCARCSRLWTLDGPKANAIADAQGFGSRAIRSGLKMEEFGATFTAGASGRRIAAGNESERKGDDLAWALSLAACPQCHQVDQVYLAK